MHDNTKMIKNRYYDGHLPRIKQVTERAVTVKHQLPRSLKRNVPTIFPSIARKSSFGSTVNNNTLIATHTETSPTPTVLNSSVYDAAQRFILRNNMAKFSHETSTVHVTHSSYPRRSTLYDHVQAKINTGLPHTDGKESPEPDTHQFEPLRPVNWSALKHEIEQDIHVRAHSKRIQFNSGVTYATQLTALGNLVRSKIKSHLSSATGSGDERYKIIVHLTVFQTSAAGLHVASRCLWDTNTDNSITIKMQGVDCDILIVAFLCYTELGAI